MTFIFTAFEKCLIEYRRMNIHCIHLRYLKVDVESGSVGEVNERVSIAALLRRVSNSIASVGV